MRALLFTWKVPSARGGQDPRQALSSPRPKALFMSMCNDHDPYDLKVQADSRIEVIGTTSNHLFWGHHPSLGQRGNPRYGTHLRTHQAAPPPSWAGSAMTGPARRSASRVMAAAGYPPGRRSTARRPRWRAQCRASGLDGSLAHSRRISQPPAQPAAGNQNLLRH